MGQVVDFKRQRRKASKPEAPAVIQSLGHSTVLITTESEKTIIIDPWLDDNPRCPAELTDLEELDYMVLSHGHSDHTGSAVSLAKKTGALVFATFELASLLNKEGVPESQLERMNKGGAVRPQGAHGLVVNLTHALHSNSFEDSEGAIHYAGEACGIVIELESGRSIYHAGDTCLFSDMALIGERFEPEVALLPIGDRFTMGPEAAAQAAKLIKPNVAIPIHYGTFELLTGTPELFGEHLKQTGAELVVLDPGEEFQF